MNLRKWLILWLVASGAVAIGSVFIHPSGPVKAQRSGTPLLSGAVIDARTFHIISASCQNCHSEKTDWPWYSYVAPVSWLLESDVQRARSHMNFSRWAEYSTDQRIALLEEIQIRVQTREMPLPRYLWLHPGAKPSKGDIDRLSDWTWMESNRLQSASAPKRTAPGARPRGYPSP
jgi:Haem-binding domain